MKGIICTMYHNWLTKHNTGTLGIIGKLTITIQTVTILTPPRLDIITLI